MRIRDKVVCVLLTAAIMVTILPQSVVLAANIDDSEVFLKQPRHSTTCTYFSAAMMLRRKAILDGNSNWNSITGDSVRAETRAAGGGMSNVFSYAGISVASGYFSGSAVEKKQQLVSLLNNHKEGVVIYTYGTGSGIVHAVLATSYENGILYVADPVYHLKRGLMPITDAYLPGGNQYERIGNLKKYWYVKNGTCDLSVPEPKPAAHTHSWKYDHYSEHPHAEYRHCSCGAKEPTGSSYRINDCISCFPLGNVSLTRKYDKTGKTVTFYRNSVQNADKYELAVTDNISFWRTINMNDKSYTLSVSNSGRYYATLTARNTNTGEMRGASCSSFEFFDTYKISYNANGGNNAPPEQTKIQNTPLTLSSLIPTKKGHIFLGWASSKSAVSAQYKAGDKYTKNTKITLYAVWKPETYTIRYDTSDCRGEVPDVAITYGDTVTMPNGIVKEFAYLKGWSESKSALEPEYKLGLDYKFSKNITLYPTWGASSWESDVASSFSGGDGSEQNPYLISNSAELAYLANMVNTQSLAPEYKYYKLTDNINLGYNEWKPIGIFSNDNQYFCGSFDGNGYVVSDMYVTNSNEGYIGLFGCAKNSVIKNLSVTGTIEGIDTTNAVKIGSVAGYALNTNTINCIASYCSLSSLSVGGQNESNVGAVIGETAGGQIIGCNVNECSINLKKGNFNAGMIVGRSDSDIIDCSVVSTEDGLFSTVPTIGSFSIGGLCGYMMKTAYRCTVNAPYFANEIQTSNASCIGGLCGYTSGKIKACTVKFTNGKIKTIDNDNFGSSIYTTGNGLNTIGGIAGKMEKDAEILDCKYDGQSLISTSNDGSILGGIAGYALVDKKFTELSIRANRRLNKSDLPTKDGYTATWYTDSALSKPYDFSATVQSDMKLYAKWEKGDDKDVHIWSGKSIEPQYDTNTKTYVIKTPEELSWISDVSSGAIKSGNNLPTDITFRGYTVEIKSDIYLNDPTRVENWENTPPKNSWKPIKQFNGSIEGGYHCISGMYVNVSGEDAGFILQGDGVVINNLRIEKSLLCVNNGSLYVAGVIARARGYIRNCSNSAKIVDKYCYSSAGGIIAELYSGEINDCYNSGDILGAEAAAGVVCSLETGSVTNSYNNGNISASAAAGGIAAYMGESYAKKSNYISNCHNNGCIVAKNSNGRSGGIVALVGAIGNCYNVITNCYDNMPSNNGYSPTSYHTDRASIVGAIGDSSAGAITSGTIKISNCYGYWMPLYHQYASSSSSCTITNVMHYNSLSEIPIFSDAWDRSASINKGYPHLRSLKDTYTDYKVIFAKNPDYYTINRVFANVDGILSAKGQSNAKICVGGVAGYGGELKGAIAIADKILIDSDGNGACGYITSASNSIENSYYNSDVIANTVTNTTGSSRGKSQLKQATFLTDIVGLNPYVSMDNIKSDETAVWVVKNGSLPELYYNCLKDIRISKDIECGTVLADKEQAVDGEIVTISAVPDNGYVLNKIYINGEELDGLTFEVVGDTDIYAIFAPKMPEYTVEVVASENVFASVVNIDEQTSGELRTALFSASDSIRAKDGEEVQVNAVANENYAVDAIYVNDEEVTGTSFIVTENSVVTMDIESLDTSVNAQTYDAENIGPNFATLGGSVESGENGTVRYVRYWKKNKPEEVYVTNTEHGGGEYRVEVMLDSATEYEYQMTEDGEIKSFTTLDDGIYPDLPSDGENECLTATSYKKLTSSNKYKFSLSCVKEIDNGIIIIAAYNENGKLIDIADIQCDGDVEYTASISVHDDMKYVKIFVLDNILSLKPFGKAEIVNIE